MGITLKLHSAEFKRHFQQATAQGLQRAGVYLHSQCVRAVNKSNTFRHVATFTRKQSSSRGGQKTGVIYESMGNTTAGRPPLKRTGLGQANIVYEYNGDEKNPIVRVGVRATAKYMIYLELGTSRVKARPWLLDTFHKYEEVLKRLACMGGRGK